MGKKRSSYLYVPLLAIVVFGVSSYVMNHNYDGKSGDNSQIYYLDEYFHAQETKVPDAHAVDKKDALYEYESVNNAKQTAQFILRLENEFVVVYRTENPAECYMVTGISAQDLPADTIEELKEGKEILDEEVLYSFLESHSS